MARTLDVYLEDWLVGHLQQSKGGQMLFRYASQWLNSADSFPISNSLPLREEMFKQKECKGFFGGILPEQSNRETVAKILQISDQNDFAMLERIGGECAGALSFVSEGDSPPSASLDADSDYRQLSDGELVEILRALPRRPLLAGEEGVRLSLAGAQDKISVTQTSGGELLLPLHYAPSTHILKPASVTWNGLVANETYCMRLARAVGLPAAATTAHDVDDIEYLLSERYDRLLGADGSIQRLHQEDFCQALGIPSSYKYQSEGGPSLKDCFDLLRRSSSSAVVDLRQLLDAVMYNLLIGNNDAHAKNYSILYGRDGTARLAPLYDLVCTAYYPEIADSFAMKLGGEKRFDLVQFMHIEAFAKDVGLAVAATKRSFSNLAEHVRDKALDVEQPDEVSADVATLIAGRCERVLAWV